LGENIFGAFWHTFPIINVIYWVQAGSVKAFKFLLKISPVKISEKKSCPLRDGNHLGQTRPNPWGSKQ
jgi:hypothetical protein